MEVTRLLRILTLGALALMLNACATQPEKPADEQAGPVFYPGGDSKHPPRIQHLARISGSDFFAQRKDSSFAKFIAGEVKENDLVQIYAARLDKGRLYVTDLKRPGIVTFDLVKQAVDIQVGSAALRLRNPVNLATDEDGTKYITDLARGQVVVMDRDDKHFRALGETGELLPMDVAITGNRLYVSDLMSKTIKVFDKQSYKLLFSFPDKDKPDVELRKPTSLAIASNGDIWVVDALAYRLQRFSADGKWLRGMGELGDSPGAFARPKGIALDRKDRLYVVDAAFQNVQLFSASGKLLLAFGQPENSEGLSLPAGISIDYDNIAYFKRFADPKFDIEYLILVASNYAPAKVDVFGFGRMQGVNYPSEDENAPPKPPEKPTAPKP